MEKQGVCLPFRPLWPALASSSPSGVITPESEQAEPTPRSPFGWGWGARLSWPWVLALLAPLREVSGRTGLAGWVWTAGAGAQSLGPAGGTCRRRLRRRQRWPQTPGYGGQEESPSRGECGQSPSILPEARALGSFPLSPSDVFWRKGKGRSPGQSRHLPKVTA